MFTSTDVFISFVKHVLSFLRPIYSILIFTTTIIITAPYRISTSTSKTIWINFLKTLLIILHHSSFLWSKLRGFVQSYPPRGLIVLLYSSFLSFSRIPSSKSVFLDELYRSGSPDRFGDSLIWIVFNVRRIMVAIPYVFRSKTPSFHYVSKTYLRHKISFNSHSTNRHPVFPSFLLQVVFRLSFFVRYISQIAFCKPWL